MVYRVGGGPPCPRCKRPLLHDGGELRCTDGHGTWLPNAILSTLLDPASLVKISKGNPFRAVALPPTRCLVCTKVMNDLYQGAVDTIVNGQCVEHGIWNEHADRDVFEAMYSHVIGPTRRQRERDAEAAEEREREEREAAERAARMHHDPVVVDLIRRVQHLEAQVAELKRGNRE